MTPGRGVGFLCLMAAAICSSQARGDLGVAGYLPDYRFYIDLNQTALHLTDLYLFSIDVNPSLGEKMLLDGVVCCLADEHLVKAQEAAAYKRQISGRNLRLWLTIGGGGRSQGLRTLTEKSHYQNFVKAAESMSNAYGIAGVDFDHEGMRNTDDARAFFRMILALAPALKKIGISISMAVHADFGIPAPVHAAVDRINVMTYDFPFADLEQVEASIQQLLDAGVLSTKLFLGIPAYGRHETNVGTVMTFAEMVDAAGTHVLDRHSGTWHEFKYDSPEMVRRKVQLAKEKNLGGVFLWELGQDKQMGNFPGGVLLESMSDEAAKHVRDDEL